MILSKFSQSVNVFPASIFAYGQTSSGKTYTMCGITGYATADIYEYVDQVCKNGPFFNTFTAYSNVYGVFSSSSSSSFSFFFLFVWYAYSMKKENLY